MQSKYDIAIIGSGLGGLATGYILAKNGYKVGIFEQGAQAGGCLQTFKRKGVTFETGMHYIGGMQEGQVLHRFFKYLSLLNDVQISPLDTEGFDVISLQGKRYKFANGYENFVEQLSQHFPQERANLQRYVQKLQDVRNSSPFYSFTNLDRIDFLDPETMRSSVGDFLNSITQNELLQNVLTGSLPLYAGAKDKTPMFIHALINDFYINGAHRVVGGSHQIANSLIRSIRGFGGDVFTFSKVEKIRCNAIHAEGITLQNGTQIAANYVISNACPDVTIDMIDSKLIRPVYRERINNLEHTVSNFTVYLKFKDGKVPYMNHNHYQHFGSSVWGGENYTLQDWPRNYLYTHLCQSEQKEHALAGEIISYMRFDEVKQWLGTSIGKRGEAYEEFKKEKAEKLLNLLEQEFPGTLENIESYYTSSPLTYLDYTGTKEGSMYGVLHDVNAVPSTHISQRTKIPNLYMVGQNINSHGILGVIIGSIITGSELLGRDFLMKQIAES